MRAATRSSTSWCVCVLVSFAARILNDVLSMQKIEDGGLTLSAEAFDLNSLVRLTVASFREALQAKSLTMHTLPSPFTLEIGEALPPGARAMVWGDKYRLRQVIANFISSETHSAVVCAHEIRCHACTDRLLGCCGVLCLLRSRQTPSPSRLRSACSTCVSRRANSRC